MRSPSKLLARIEALELMLKPKGRVFVFVDIGGAAASFWRGSQPSAPRRASDPRTSCMSSASPFTDPADKPSVIPTP